ncbi:hypothetical protein DNH61_02655 [Paenibacillus sambharensis]|uniref:Uncharacterized protein n=1 Tax=Paenibacillus sambharensis TaxID=1803190 RepID=A0A2W1LR02_9BACL|nr:hypothetical protein DNH61_02655 [Paenibacillus sambharensis]
MLDGEIIYEANTDKWIKNGEENIERMEFIRLLQEYPNLSIQDALQSDVELVKGLALIDRRVGRRKLKTMDCQEFLNSDFLKILYEARCGEEGIGAMKRSW